MAEELEQEEGEKVKVVRRRKRRKNRHAYKTTKDKILTVATRVFAEYGFRAATTRMICESAGVNIALVNYYFESKAELYRQVVVRLFAGKAKTLIKLPDTVHDEETWKAAIRQWLVELFRVTAAVKPPEVYISRLMGMEESVPSTMRREMELEFAIPVRKAFLRLLRMAMPDADELTLQVFASMISAQCSIYALVKPSWGDRFRPANVSTEEWMTRVVDTVCEVTFSYAHFQRVI